ncbi:MraY family glycosyltransferase [Muriicola sp. Z0-33]|uniref:MraY family glycosyltransferase n=1 Tax=Muriicola sp. Z0-33 TaxID=2816957 RepID=UPI0022384978|nr:MraY family glycosyltransferase [Muriicola sp. Z0-33]MCW5516897.1 undecaprenyl/decaprenyl-phosphate alpha-N-acetylglucosaminyl 1-phosphate transferase [Muriicola sp. Z0-33]
MTYISSLLSNSYLLSIAAIILTFLVANRIFPIIIYTVRSKNLMDEPGDRSIHGTKTPTLGGVGVFVAFAVSLILFGVFKELDRVDLVKLLTLLAGTMVLLFLGIKDDLLALSPRKKFIGQLFAVAIVIFFTDVRIADFNGLLGITALPYPVSVLFTVFVFILINNSYNMIDGIDGLAGTIAIIASGYFGIYFLINGNVLLSLVSFVLIGALIGFLRFNLSHSRKLFMGDSGTMFIGYLLAYQGVSFLTINELPNTVFTVPNAQIMFIAVLSFPLLDTLRVFVIRISKKGSPFKADRNHIHHKLLHLGLEHRQATMFVALSNILIVIAVVFMDHLSNGLQLILSVGLGALLYLTPLIILGRKQSRTVRSLDLIDAEELSELKLTKEDLANLNVFKDNPPMEEELILEHYTSKEQQVEEVAKKNKPSASPQMQSIIARRLEALKKMMVKQEQ